MMKICIPTRSDKGNEALISAHFGSAPFFTIYDTDSASLDVIKNQNEHHEHGQCHSLRAVAGLDVEVVIAAGLGHRALEGLNSAGIRVYKTAAKTVSEVLGHLDDHLREPMTGECACGHGHSHDADRHEHEYEG
jgi:predicted Fe-Mo cluster-binding NifX family protein